MPDSIPKFRLRSVQMTLYRPRGQEEEEQLRSEDAPPPDDRLAEGAPTEATEPGSEEAERQQQQDRRADGALGRTDFTFSTASRPRRRRRHHRRPVVARIVQRELHDIDQIPRVQGTPLEPGPSGRSYPLSQTIPSRPQTTC